jgi:hypothetical protein
MGIMALAAILVLAYYYLDDLGPRQLTSKQY